MARVIIYTKSGDPYSARAKKLLDMKGLNYVERQLPDFADEMQSKTGTHQTPQVIINGKHIGSFDELGSLDLKGKLDKLLKRP